VSVPALVERTLDDLAAQPVRHRGGDDRVAELVHRQERVRLIKRCQRALELGRSRKLSKLLDEFTFETWDADSGEVWEWEWGMDESCDIPGVLEANLSGQLYEDRRIISRLAGELRAERRRRRTRRMARRCEPVRDRTGTRPRERRGRHVRRRSSSSRAGPDSEDPEPADGRPLTHAANGRPA
jgi:hypothetical protein